VVAVLNSKWAGREAGEVIDGKADGIPVEPDLLQAVKRAGDSGNPPTQFVIGLAPDGGRLPAAARADLMQANRLDLQSGRRRRETACTFSKLPRDQ
jgi:hypothetical protein